MSEGDGSTDGDSINARNPSSTGMGCFKNYEHAQRNRVYSSQVLIEMLLQTITLIESAMRNLTQKKKH